MTETFYAISQRFLNKTSNVLPISLNRLTFYIISVSHGTLKNGTGLFAVSLLYEIKMLG